MADRIVAAFILGLVARGTDRAESDIDVLVISIGNQRAYSSQLGTGSPVSRRAWSGSPAYVEDLGCGLEGTTEGSPRLRIQASAHDDHAVVVDPGVEVAARVTLGFLLSLLATLVECADQSEEARRI